MVAVVAVAVVVVTVAVVAAVIATTIVTSANHAGNHTLHPDKKFAALRGSNVGTYLSMLYLCVIRGSLFPRFRSDLQVKLLATLALLQIHTPDRLSFLPSAYV